MLKKPLLLVLLVGLASFGSVAGATVLKIATLAPDSTTWMQEFRKAAKQIAARTENRVKIKYYPGGVMGNDQAVLRKMRIGQLHGGAVTGGSLAEIYPDAQIYSMPMQFESIAEVNYVRGKMDRLIGEGLASKGLVMLGLSNGGFAYFAGSTEVKGVADLKEQRVWLPQGDQIGAAMYSAAGISPVPLPLPDVYTALQTGMLNTIVGNTSSMIAFQWHGNVKYLADAPIIFLVGMIVVKKRAFDRIAQADQKVVHEEMQKAFTLLDDLNNQDNIKAREVLKSSGVKFVPVSAEEKKRWDELAVMALEKLGEAGAYTEKYLKLMQQYIKEYRQQSNIAKQ